MAIRNAVLATAWGLFAACSWTWCIGMFLPKLLVERYGLPGFALFAVPNVLGCAAFGYVLARRDRGRRLAADHAPALATFSLAAVAFHLFFVAFLLDRFVLAPGAAPWLAPLAPVAVYVVGRLLADLGDRAWLTVAALVYAFSLVAFAVVGTGAWPRLQEPGTAPAPDLAWLAPVFVAGFALCPYLDATFHRALAASPSRHAFAVFGAAFAVMIVFTCFLWFAPSPRLLGVGLGHLVAQSTFTVGAHLREARRSPAFRCRHRRRLYALLPLLAAPLLLVARLVSDAPDLGEDLYLRFMVLYGLVFPAYVLVFVGPGRPVPRTGRALALAALVVAALLPLYELAFLHGRTWLLAVPAVALAAWLVARLAPRGGGDRAAPHAPSSGGA